MEPQGLVHFGTEPVLPGAGVAFSKLRRDLNHICSRIWRDSRKAIYPPKCLPIWEPKPLISINRNIPVGYISQGFLGQAVRSTSTTHGMDHFLQDKRTLEHEGSFQQRGQTQKGKQGTEVTLVFPLQPCLSLLLFMGVLTSGTFSTIAFPCPAKQNDGRFFFW